MVGLGSTSWLTLSFVAQRFLPANRNFAERLSVGLPLRYPQPTREQACANKHSALRVIVGPPEATGIRAWEVVGPVEVV